MGVTADPTDRPSIWERGLELAALYGPYYMLAPATVLALAIEPAADPLITFGLAGLAAAWTFGLGPKRQPVSQGRLRLYYLGFLVLGGVMMAHHPLFLIYPVAGFFQVHLLRPMPVTFLGVFLTSVVVNGLIVVGEAGAQNVGIFGVVVAIQTLAIGFGVVGGEKLNELNESRREAVMELERALEQNENLQAQLVAQARQAGMDDERQRLAREIHDTIAQGLTAVITQLEAADHVRRDEDEWRRHLDNAIRIARESLVEARRAVRAAVPLPLDGRTVPEAIGEVVERWSKVNQIDTDWSVTGEPIRLHPELEVTLLRTVQESLANVAKHAGAGRVAVTLSYMGDTAAIDVRDDGKGFDPDLLEEGFGLRGMRSRIDGLGGTLQVEAEPGRGTAISATVPAIGVQDA